ncbi:MAG TPA: class I tRNA ligase family protein, partial [Candidatus Polarisedimenticolaceae bacterium]|nr:class I tRNA ligase family protein [Candidatus Polarisedimenticolaceae bacterium]
IGPYDQGIPWNPTGIDGTKRFLNRVWTLVQEHLEARGKVLGDNTGSDQALETALATVIHKTIKKVTVDLGKFGFNTAIAAQMELVNELYRLKTRLPLGSEAWQQNLRLLVAMLAPFAPHITEELWEQLGGEGSVHVAGWPTFDPSLVKEDLTTIVLQVNGKTRGQMEIGTGAPEDEVKRLAAEQENVVRHVAGKKIIKTIYVADKLVNFVVK